MERIEVLHVRSLRWLKLENPIRIVLVLLFSYLACLEVSECKSDSELLLKAFDGSVQPGRRPINDATRQKNSQHGQAPEAQGLGKGFDDDPRWRYLSNEELEKYLKGFITRCSDIARVENIGKSVRGVPVYSLGIARQFGAGLPKVKIIGNLHGDEPTGRVLTIALAEWICENYEKDKLAGDVLENVELWMVPTMNPDGFAMHTRGNAHMVDLNRNFPDRFQDSKEREKIACTECMVQTGNEEQETKVIMDWIVNKGPFVSSLAIHEGALVANYPYDGSADGSATYAASPDDDTFKYLATLYSKTHRKMSLPTNSEFPDGGITNGAAWYPIYGGMQDWNYLVANCMELTLEVSPRKWPDESTLKELFEDNRMSMLKFIMQSSYGGLHGTVLRAPRDRKMMKIKEPVSAFIQALGSNLTTETADNGKFYRPLAPGKHQIMITADGYSTVLFNVSIPKGGNGIKKTIYLQERSRSIGLDFPVFEKISDSMMLHTIMVFTMLSCLTVIGILAIHFALVKRQRKISQFHR